VSDEVTERTGKSYSKVIPLLLPILTLLFIATFIVGTTKSFIPYMQTESFRAPAQIGSAGSVPGAAPSTGEPRDVDEEKIRRMIQQKQLSEHEAEFYRKIPSEEE